MIKPIEYAQSNSYTLSEEQLSTLRYHLLKAEELSARLQTLAFEEEPINWTVIGIGTVICTALFVAALFALERFAAH